MGVGGGSAAYSLARKPRVYTYFHRMIGILIRPNLESIRSTLVGNIALRKNC